MNIRPKVLRGAALLDEIRPGWEFEIDLGSLDLSRYNKCILGQLYDGSFNAGLLRLFGTFDTRKAGEHGFGGTTEEWVALIQARRAAADAPEQVQETGVKYLTTIAATLAFLLWSLTLLFA